MANETGAVLGMTGTSNPITAAQQSWLDAQVWDADVLHHGACVGADAAAHRAAIDAGVDIVVHPPVDERLMMPRGLGQWLPAKPYLDRNRDIVDACDRLIALPDGPPKPKSGTWYTVRYAVERGKDVTVCLPDGSVHRGADLLAAHEGAAGAR